MLEVDAVRAMVTLDGSEQRKKKSMKEQCASRGTAEERRIHLTALLAHEQQGSAMEQRIDIEMRLLLVQYDSLEEQRVRLLEEESLPSQDDNRSFEKPAYRVMADIDTLKKTIRARLEFAGDLLDIDSMVVAACLSTISLHYVEHEESSFEHAYPLLQGYFLGENTLLFPQLGFLTKEEVLQILEIEQEDREEA